MYVVTMSETLSPHQIYYREQTEKGTLVLAVWSCARSSASRSLLSQEEVVKGNKLPSSCLSQQLL